MKYGLVGALAGGLIAIVPMVVMLTAAGPVTSSSASPPAVEQAGPAEPGTVVADTTSYYMASTDSDAVEELGCANGEQHGRMTIFFGRPLPVDGDYGANMWAAGPQTTDTVADAVRQFASGYARCRADSDHQLMIGVGTSNSQIDQRSDQWLENHGHAWAATVADLAAWADENHPEAVAIYGAWDAEPAWSTLAKARQWLEGYESHPDHRPFHANFSADGCSWESSTNEPCANGWDQHDLWELASRDASLPIPQIYSNNGRNAGQWKMISAYGAREHDQPLQFHGALSQVQACEQRGGCEGISNTPEEARQQLLDALNEDPATAQDDVGTVSDMRWFTDS